MRFWVHPESGSAFTGADDEDMYEADDTRCLMEVDFTDFLRCYAEYYGLTAEDMQLIG